MARDGEIESIFKQFKKANQKLKEAVKLEEETEIKRDAVIQRFEFTFELLWKTFKKIAGSEKIDSFSPKTSFRSAFQLGLISDEEIFMEIIDARNKTTHVYSEEDAKEIYEFVEEKVVDVFKSAEEKIEGYLVGSRTERSRPFRTKGTR
ncbi:MAG: HI0074 family nucleotidyltransferase substrate-binding subunit [Candidatus Omnitrophota bacterium]